MEIKFDAVIYSVGSDGVILQTNEGYQCVKVVKENSQPAPMLRKALANFQSDLLWSLKDLANACRYFGITIVDLHNEDPEGLKEWLQRGKEYPWPWSPKLDADPARLQARKELIAQFQPSRAEGVKSLCLGLEEIPDDLQKFLEELAA